VCALREPKKATKGKEEFERRSSSVNSFFWGKGSNFQMEIIIWLQLIENCAKSQLLYKLLLLCAEEAEEEEEEAHEKL
jgi:hypothetical protein